MDTRQRICAGLLLGFLAAALLLPHVDYTLLLLLPPLLALITARLRFSLPPSLTRALATTLGAATLALCWAQAETLARQATHRAEYDAMLGESAFLTAIAAASPPDFQVWRQQHTSGWPTPGGLPRPLTFQWAEAEGLTADPQQTCGLDLQRLTRAGAPAHAMIELPRVLRDHPPGTHPVLIALALALAWLLTRPTALARMLVGAALLTGLAWARTPVTLDETYAHQLTLAAQRLVSERAIDPTTLTPCPAPPDVRFIAAPTGVWADTSRHDERKWLILMSFLGASLALGAVLGLVIHGVERPRPARGDV